jgi:transposase-like protein
MCEHQIEKLQSQKSWMFTVPIHRPECRSDAVYKYGHTSSGKQRFICLLCERQFVVDPENIHFKNKPKCPECGKLMHSYMKAVNHIRFRCSDYPRCKTYLKLYELAFEIIDAEMISNNLSIEQFIGRVKGKTGTAGRTEKMGDDEGEAIEAA